jgi:hypothetical protein
MPLPQGWIVPDWPLPPNVRAVCTTRAGGHSLAPYDGLNLGDHVGDAPEAVAANRALFAEAIGARPVFLNQVHGRATALLTGTEPDGTEADACRCCWQCAMAARSPQPMPGGAASPDRSAGAFWNRRGRACVTMPARKPAKRWHGWGPASDRPHSRWVLRSRPLSKRRMPAPAPCSNPEGRANGWPTWPVWPDGACRPWD